MPQLADKIVVDVGQIRQLCSDDLPVFTLVRLAGDFFCQIFDGLGPTLTLARKTHSRQISSQVCLPVNDHRACPGGH